ncbi:MAG: hypothetical protein RMI35_00945 [Leptospiraceae bacterium]|nr:hypothetical protein [Leptospiraceae bacterium]
MMVRPLMRKELKAIRLMMSWTILISSKKNFAFCSFFSMEGAPYFI